MPCDPFRNQISFRLREIERLRDVGCGIYGFWFGKNCIYVGKADLQAIYSRLVQHYKGTHNRILRLWIEAKGPRLRVSYKAISNSADIDVMERVCIQRFKPLANVIQYHVEVDVPDECL